MKINFSRPPFAIIALCLIAFCLAVFYPALRNEFVWDDTIFLVRSSAYSGANRIAASLLEPFALFGAYYRPLIALSFALIPATLDHSPVIHHAINIAIHAANVVLVYLCAQQVMPRALGSVGAQRNHLAFALGAAMIFAVHPLVLEPVLWVSGRFDLSLTLFCLLFVYVNLIRRDSLTRTLLLAAIYFCAAVSKESAVSLPLAIVVLHTFLWSFEAKSCSWMKFIWGQRNSYIAMLVAGIAYLLLRTYAMGHASTGTGAAKAVLSFSGNGSDRIALASLALIEYAKLVFLSWTTTAPLHPYDLHAVGDLTRWMAPAAVVVVLVALLTSTVKLRWRWPYVALIFVAMIWPVLHFFSFSATTSLIADRYALAPFAFSLIVAAPLCAAHFESASISRIFALTLGLVSTLVMVSWIALARITTQVWHDDVALWAYAYALAPQSDMASTNYVASLLRVGKLDEAEVIVQSLRERGTASMAPLTNLALIKAVRGDFEAAYGILRAVDVQKTVGLSNDDLATYFCSFAQVDMLDGNWAEALKHSADSLRYDPQLVSCQLIKARALFGVGSKVEALALITKVKPAIAPDRQKEVEQLIRLWQTTE